MSIFGTNIIDLPPAGPITGSEVVAVVQNGVTSRTTAGEIGGGTSPLTTKGDIYTYSTTDARLGVGADGTVLVADSAEATGLKWQAVAGTGTVTSVSVATANGVSGTVANATTTPAITLVLGAITPSSVASVGTVTGSNLSGTNTGDQNIFSTIAVSGQSDVVADSTSDTLTLVAGSNITITTNASTDSITIAASASGSGDVVGPASATDNAIARFDGTTGKLIQNSAATIADTSGNITAGTYNGNTIGAGSTSGANTGDQNLFSTIAVSGQSDVVADSTSDTLTLVAGTNITITTNASTDSITIAAASGGSVSFDGISSGTNTTAAMVVGTGASLAASGSGTITATDATANLVTGKTGVTPDGADYILISDTSDSGNLKKALISDLPSGGGGAPAGAEYVTLSTNGSLTDERVLTAGTGISITDAGAGSTVTVASTITQYTDEMAQDAVGAMVDSTLVYTDAIPLLSRAALTGDVTASAGSNATTIANDAVTYAKMQNVSATDRLLGRSSSGAGDVEEIACTAAGRALLDDADAAAQRATLGVGAIGTLSTIVATITCVFDGMGSVLVANSKVYLEIPFAMTITGWTIIADQSGSCVIDVWKDTYANYPPTVADTIAGTEKPTLSSAAKNQDLTLSTWTTSVSAGDTLVFNVDSATTVTKVTVVIRGTRAE